MSAGNDCPRAFLSRGRQGLYVELVTLSLLEAHLYPSLVDECLSASDSVVVHIAQHLQSVLALPRYGSERYGYRESHHPCSGYADTHGVLQHVSAQHDVDALRQSAESLCRLCHTESHGYRLSASYGGDYLTSDEVYYLVA